MLLALLTLVVGASASTDNFCEDGFGFASYYTSHMVLQRAPSQAVIWGYAQEDGDPVTLTVDTEIYSTTAAMGPTGRPEWRVTVAAREASDDPITITAESLDCSETLRNVLFGDVYICSGQSNMAHLLQNIDDADPDIEDVVNYPNVRTFQAGLEYSDEPQYDLIRVQSSWVVPQPEFTRFFSAICWLFGKRLYEQYGRPIGLIQSAWGGTRIQAWSSPDALEVCFPDGPGDGNAQNAASVLYNAMIHPFLPMPIFGAIWYQGEANAGQSELYGCAVREMVEDWRRKWSEGTGGQTNPDFPFGQCQLAPNNLVENPNVGFPKLRWAQTGYVGYLPNEQGFTNHFMAVAADLPDFDSPHGSIHPRYKRQIADRLALAAFPVAYDDTSSLPSQGPFPTSLLRDNPAQLTVTFDHGAGDIELRESGEAWTVGYEVCCASSETTCWDGDERWEEAPIVTSTASSVTLTTTCDQAQVITGLRYLWRESPCELEMCPIYSRVNSLPAPPYRFDGLIEGLIHI